MELNFTNILAYHYLVKMNRMVKSDFFSVHHIHFAFAESSFGNMIKTLLSLTKKFRDSNSLFRAFVPGVHYFIIISGLFSYFNPFLVAKFILVTYVDYFEIWQDVTNIISQLIPPIFVPSHLNSGAISAFTLLFFPTIFLILKKKREYLRFKNGKSVQKDVPDGGDTTLHLEIVFYYLFHRYLYPVSLFIVLLIWTYHDIWPTFFNLIVTLLSSFLNQHVGFGISSVSDVLVIGIAVETIIIFLINPRFFVYMLFWIVFLSGFVLMCLFTELIVEILISFDFVSKILNEIGIRYRSALAE